MFFFFLADLLSLEADVLFSDVHLTFVCFCVTVLGTSSIGACELLVTYFDFVSIAESSSVSFAAPWVLCLCSLLCCAVGNFF